MFPMFTLMLMIIIPLFLIMVTYITLSSFLASQLDQFKNTIRNIQTALIAEYRCNGKEWEM